MASYAPERVIYVGSLSKLLLPALRIGYVAAPAALIDALAHFISVTEGMGNTLTEDAAAELINSGELRRHARKVTRIYAARRLSFAAALREQMADSVDFRMPDGGLAFWLTFPRWGDLDRIEGAAPSLGLRLAPSRSFATTEDAPRGLRIGFASLDQAEACRAIGLLASA
jgi:GntR family transcriptional regulator/MocR family aminotransferase